MLKKAQYTFTDDMHLTIHAAESIVSDYYSEIVKKDIERIFLYRFGFELYVNFEFDSEFEFSFIDESEKQFENELKNISERAGKVDKAAKEAKENQDKQDAVQGEKKPENTKPAFTEKKTGI